LTVVVVIVGVVGGGVGVVPAGVIALVVVIGVIVLDLALTLAPVLPGRRSIFWAICLSSGMPGEFGTSPGPAVLRQGTWGIPGLPEQRSVQERSCPQDHHIHTQLHSEHRILHRNLGSRPLGLAPGGQDLRRCCHGCSGAVSRPQLPRQRHGTQTHVVRAGPPLAHDRRRADILGLHVGHRGRDPLGAHNMRDPPVAAGVGSPLREEIAQVARRTDGVGKIPGRATGGLSVQGQQQHIAYWRCPSARDGLRSPRHRRRNVCLTKWSDCTGLCHALQRSGILTFHSTRAQRILDFGVSDRQHELERYGLGGSAGAPA